MKIENNEQNEQTTNSNQKQYAPETEDGGFVADGPIIGALRFEW